MASTLKSIDDVRRRILNAAGTRFSQFGYAKTNVAEIAADCRMSPGNLYRYFKNKADIAEVIMREAMDQVLDELRSVFELSHLSAADRFREFVVREMHFTYNQLQTYPTLQEQVRDPLGKGPMLAQEYLERSQGLLAEILRDGVEAGEFALDDPEAAASYIQDATLKFRYPQLHSCAGLTELEPQLEGVVELVLTGLLRR
ncbi:MAG: TetR family transcriptional regulator [Alphaproteobacteria bacterium]|nr:TetR family transcriptional regulator [Alphaproteobacteria bacterium]